MIQGKCFSSLLFNTISPFLFSLPTNTSNSVSCRLPQTPKTPGAGMAHYFDDTFHRHAYAKLPRTPSTPRLRRSSTSRSIGMRSDYEVEANGEHGDARRGSISSSALFNDPARAREQAEADAHMHNYITEQLERVRSEQSVGSYQGGEEFEAQV